MSEVLTVVRELAADGMTLMSVTHEMKFARDECSRVVFMHEGRVHEIGRPDNSMNCTDAFDEFGPSTAIVLTKRLRT